MHDSTTGERSEETIAALRDANEALRHFAHSAAHDLQAPLRHLVLFAERLRESSLGRLEPEAQEDLEQILDAAGRMKTLTQALLDLGEVEHESLQRERFPLERAACTALDVLSESVRAGHAEVVVDELPEIVGDERLWTIVFTNLISNALKFVAKDRSPQIEVRCDTRDAEWQIHVEDNGIGIDEEDRGEVFRPFRRLHSRERYVGHGLGLAVTARIVARHRGSIAVTRSSSDGTIITITVPRPAGDSS